MFEEADNYFADIFRGGLPYYLLITLPILIICTSNPVLASNEFNIQRMSQFDVHGVPYGCRASALNLEAKSLNSWKTSRHCIVTRFQDLSLEQFREIRSKAGGLIALLPDDLSTLTLDEKQHIYALEQAMLAQEISIPVFFSKFNGEFNDIIEDIAADSKDSIGGQPRESALSELINSVSANGYQIVVSGATHAANKQSKLPIIHGELAPVRNLKNGGDAIANTEINNKLPLIIVTAHMDTFGLVNDHMNNVDLAVFLTLMETFSKIASSTSTTPKYRLLFLLSEGGNLLNFQGVKKWLDTHWEETQAVQNPEFVLCLDSVGQNTNGDGQIYMHVSKPPKDGTNVNKFFKQLKATAQTYANATVEGIHKKINLADVQLAWEHERFSIKRLSAFTLSSLKSHKDPLRNTIFEESRADTIAVAQRNAKIIAESLATHIYGREQGEILTGTNAISKEQVSSWLNIRSSLLNNDLRNAFEKYLKNVKITYDKPDAREPDFMLYEGSDAVLNVYSVKPAVFDLFLTFAICAYLGVVYLAITVFPDLYEKVSKISSKNYIKVKSN